MYIRIYNCIDIGLIISMLMELGGEINLVFLFIVLERILYLIFIDV